MTINLHLPTHQDTFKPKITVIGVGGAGGNAVNNMIAANLEGVDFVIANTDAQALEIAMTERVVQLGSTVTRGLGAGANPKVGQAAAQEALDEIADHIGGSNMVFITAGMGGGTGTGAAPVIAQLARNQGILTVGVVTKPFQFEGTHRMRIAESGLEELQQYVDTLIVIPNQNLFRIANEKTTFAEAFRMADEVLHSGVRGVTDLMVKPGLVNLDFADIRAVMSEMGKAMMGTGEAQGDKRATDAAESAINNPLLDDVSLKGAKAVLINITGGPDMTLFEVDEAANRIRDEVDPNANIIFGSTFSDAMEGKMRVSVVATGIGDSVGAQRTPSASSLHPQQQPKPQMPKPSAPSSYDYKRERSAAEIVRQAGLAATESNSMTQSAPVIMNPIATPTSGFSSQKQSIALQQDEQFVMEMPTQDRRQPFRLGEVKEQVDAPLFVSSPAEYPAQRTLHVTAETDYEANEEMDEEPSGFFSRLAGVGKAIAGKARTNENESEDALEFRVEESQSSSVKTAVRPQASDDENQEYLDIPAFLRRQAN